MMKKEEEDVETSAQSTSIIHSNIQRQKKEEEAEVAEHNLQKEGVDTKVSTHNCFVNNDQIRPGLPISGPPGPAGGRARALHGKKRRLHGQKLAQLQREDGDRSWSRGLLSYSCHRQQKKKGVPWRENQHVVAIVTAGNCPRMHPPQAYPNTNVELPGKQVLQTHLLI